MQTDLSVNAIKDFLDRMRQEKKMASLQVSRFKTSLNKIIDGEDDDTCKDMSSVDTGALFARFRARNTSYNDTTIQTYENTFTRLVTEFLRYTNGPDAYTFQTRARKKNTVKREATLKGKSKATDKLRGAKARQ